MSDVLVVYATKTGCTEGVARRIGEVLSAQGAQVTLAPAGDAPAAAEFDAVVVGSGVRAGAWHPSAKAWVVENADALKARPVAFFTCGMMITQGAQKVDEVRAYSAPVSDEAGIEPVDVGLFAGWFVPKQFPFVERAILKAMKTPQGDYRDWDAIDRWAAGVAPDLGVAS